MASFYEQCKTARARVSSKSSDGGKFTLLVEKTEEKSEFGVTIKETNTDYPVITDVEKGSYAYKSGLHVGDYVITINGINTNNMSLAMINNKIKSVFTEGHVYLGICRLPPDEPFTTKHKESTLFKSRWPVKDQPDSQQALDDSVPKVDSTPIADGGMGQWRDLVAKHKQENYKSELDHATIRDLWNKYIKTSEIDDILNEVNSFNLDKANTKRPLTKSRSFTRYSAPKREARVRANTLHTRSRSYSHNTTNRDASTSRPPQGPIYAEVETPTSSRRCPTTLGTAPKVHQMTHYVEIVRYSDDVEPNISISTVLSPVTKSAPSPNTVTVTYQPATKLRSQPAYGTVCVTTPEPVSLPTAKPITIPTREPVAEQTPEPMTIQTSEPVTKQSPESTPKPAEYTWSRLQGIRKSMGLDKMGARTTPVHGRDTLRDYTNTNNYKNNNDNVNRNYDNKKVNKIALDLLPPNPPAKPSRSPKHQDSDIDDMLAELEHLRNRNNWFKTPPKNDGIIPPPPPPPPPPPAADLPPPPRLVFSTGNEQVEGNPKEDKIEEKFTRRNKTDGDIDDMIAELDKLQNRNSWFRPNKKPKKEDPSLGTMLTIPPEPGTVLNTTPADKNKDIHLYSLEDDSSDEDSLDEGTLYINLPPRRKPEKSDNHLYSNMQEARYNRDDSILRPKSPGIRARREQAKYFNRDPEMRYFGKPSRVVPKEIRLPIIPIYTDKFKESVVQTDGNDTLNRNLTLVGHKLRRSPDTYNNYVKCGSCVQPIGTLASIHLDNTNFTYHQRCFSCKHCGENLLDNARLLYNVFVIDGMPYCDLCIKRMGMIRLGKVKKMSLKTTV